MPINDIVTPIMANYLHAVNLRRAKEQQDLENALAQQKFQEQIKEFEAQQGEVKRYHDAEISARKAEFGLRQFEAKQNFQKSLAEGLTPGTESGDQITAQLPEELGGGEISSISPTALRQRALDTERQKQKIITDENIRQQVDAYIQTRAQKLADEIAKTNATNDAELKKQIEIEKVRGANSKEIEELRSKKSISLEALKHRYKMEENQTDPFTLGNILKDLSLGTITTEDLTKFGFKMGERKHVLESLQSQGYKPINNETKRKLQGFGPVLDIYQSVERANQLIKEDPTKSFLPFSDARTLINTVKARLGQLASGIGGQKGAISQKDVDAMKAFLPNFVFSKPNDIIIDKFKNLINRAQVNALPGISAIQRADIIEHYGLLPEDEEEINATQKK